MDRPTERPQPPAQAHLVFRGPHMGHPSGDEANHGAPGGQERNDKAGRVMKDLEAARKGR